MRRLPAAKGRVVALFGAPGAGLSTIVECLADASNKRCVIVEWDHDNDPAALTTTIDEHRPQADVIFVDAIHTADEIRTLVESGHVDGAGQGRIVQVMNMAALGDAPDIVIKEWNKRRAIMEQTVQLYSLPYFTLQNVWGDLEAPVAELARVARLRS